MVPIRQLLELEEAELVLGLLRGEILEYSLISKLKLLSGEITPSDDEWNQSHAGYLKDIHKKLTNQEFQ